MANTGVCLAEEEAHRIRAMQSKAQERGSSEVRDSTHAALMRRIARTETSPTENRVVRNTSPLPPLALSAHKPMHATTSPRSFGPAERAQIKRKGDAGGNSRNTAPTH